MARPSDAEPAAPPRSIWTTRLLYGERAKANDPHKWVVVGEQSREIYSCMVRKDDPQFLAVVNGALGDLYSSGKSTASTSAGSNSRFRPRA
jgi:hypothetical protein